MDKIIGHKDVQDMIKNKRLILDVLEIFLSKNCELRTEYYRILKFREFYFEPRNRTSSVSNFI